MPTAETRRRILDAAEDIFAQHGYAGASIRTITAQAEVDLGAVRYHFGSKDALFGEVMSRRLEPLCEERLRLLEIVEDEAGDDPPELERIIEAFLKPAVTLVLDEDHGRSWTKLIGRVRVEPGSYLDSVQGAYGNLLVRFLSAFKKALPDLPEDELAYRFYFLFGTEVNTLIDDGTLHAMGKSLPDVYQDPQGVCARLVRFVAAGMRASMESTNGKPASDSSVIVPQSAKGASPPEDHTPRSRVG